MTRAKHIWRGIEKAALVFLNVAMLAAIFTGHIDYATLFTAQICLLHILDMRAAQ